MLTLFTAVLLFALSLSSLSADEVASAKAALEGYYSVKEFGAVGDGKTDDTKAVQSAINTARERGGVVWLPPGSYCVGSLDMTGISRGVTLSGASPGASNLVPVQSGVPVLDLTGSYFTNLRDFSISGAQPGVVPQIGLLLDQTPGIPSNMLNLENLYVSGSFTVATLYCHCVCSSSITRCEFYNYYNSPDTAAVAFTRSNYANIASKFIKSLPKDAGNCSDWTFTGCEIHDLCQQKGKPSQSTALRLDGTMQMRWFGGNISGEGPQLIRMEGFNSHIMILGTTLYTELGSAPGVTVRNSGELRGMSIQECVLTAKDAVFAGPAGAVFDEITFHSKPRLYSPPEIRIVDCPEGRLTGSQINCDGCDLRLKEIRKTLLIRPGKVTGELTGVTRVE